MTISINGHRGEESILTTLAVYCFQVATLSSRPSLRFQPRDPCCVSLPCVLSLAVLYCVLLPVCGRVFKMSDCTPASHKSFSLCHSTALEGLGDVSTASRCEVFLQRIRICTPSSRLGQKLSGLG